MPEVMLHFLVCWTTSRIDGPVIIADFGTDSADADRLEADMEHGHRKDVVVHRLMCESLEGVLGWIEERFDPIRPIIRTDQHRNVELLVPVKISKQAEKFIPPGIHNPNMN